MLHNYILRKLLTINVDIPISTDRTRRKTSCNKPCLYSSTYPLNVTIVEANPLAKKSAIAANRSADRKCALRQFAWTITMKWRETSRGDLTDKLRGMIVKRIKEARGRGQPVQESARPALWDRMSGAIIYFILIISEQEEGRLGFTRYTWKLRPERRGAKRERYSFGFRTSPTRKRVVMHVISRDAASGCPLCDSRRKPPSWKTCMWIDRFLYAIVAIVMPVAFHKSLLFLFATLFLS